MNDAPPRILLLGDSICMGYSNGPGYGGFVRDALAPLGIKVTLQACAGSAALLASLPDLLGEAPWDVVHFNCGLHDLKRDRATGVVHGPVDAYARNLDAIVTRLAATRARLVWATITPVHDAWHQTYKPFDRREEDVIAYNEAALRCTSRADIAVNDLHDLIVRHGQERTQFSDGVHFTEPGSRAMASAVVAAVLGAMGLGAMRQSSNTDAGHP